MMYIGANTESKQQGIKIWRGRRDVTPFAALFTLKERSNHGPLPLRSRHGLGYPHMHDPPQLPYRKIWKRQPDNQEPTMNKKSGLEENEKDEKLSSQRDV